MSKLHLLQLDSLAPIYSFPDKPYCAASAFCVVLNYRLYKLGLQAALDPEDLFSRAYPNWTEKCIGPSGQIFRYVELWNEGAISTFPKLEGIFPCAVEKEKLTAIGSLARLKSFLEDFRPIIVEVPLYLSSFSSPWNGVFATPSPSDRQAYLGMHLMVADGYDDEWCSGNSLMRKGALTVRNCWGTSWGIRGRGILPYAYLADVRTCYFYVFKWSRT